MKVLELMHLSLLSLNEDTDDMTREEYADQLLEYFNQAYGEIMRAYYPVFCEQEICVGTGGQYDLSGLERPFIEAKRLLRRDGRQAEWSVEGSTLFTAPGSGRILYRYMPDRLAADGDEPVFPADMHYCLSDYAAYRVLSCGSRARQARGEVYYGSYLSALGKLGQRKNTRLLKKYS
ncbi:MAG: hypothetical protein ACOYI4_00855 [Christensenellales bacterium]|jgi:hypothetical protein